MGDIDIKRISPLKRRIKLLEGAMLTCVGGMALAFYQEEDMVGYYLAFLFGVLYIWKYYTLLQLDKRQFLANVVEQRTIELRSQRDAIRAESQKLSNALTKLAEAQDELVRKERMASIGQLTKGLVDRILNPLNYINNFGRLSMSLIEDLEHNVEADHKAGNTINYEDSRELLSMLSMRSRLISSAPAIPSTSSWEPDLDLARSMRSRRCMKPRGRRLDLSAIIILRTS